MGNEAKRAEIQVVAQVISSLVMLPEIEPLLEAAIMLGWAYAESVYDVQTLLAGGQIPLMKTDSSWHYGLAAALAGVSQESQMQGSGMGYDDYLRMFMMLTSEEVLTARAMNMVELDIRATKGNENFRLDACYTAIGVELDVENAAGHCYRIVRERRYE